MSKKILALLLALCLVFSFLLTSCSSCEDETPDDGKDGEDVPGDGGSGKDDSAITPATFTFALNTDGTGYIVTGATIQSPQRIAIPAKHDSLPVVAIAEGAFMGHNSITALIIPDSVKSIGANAFARCDGITTLQIGYGVESIGDYAFFGLSSLNKITVHEANPVYKAENGCLFEKTGGTLLLGTFACSIPNDGSITRIGNGALAFMTLSAITIPKSVTSFGENVLYANPQVLSFYYEGSAQDWEAITKPDNWKDEISYTFTVICHEGDHGVTVTPPAPQDPQE